MGDKIQRVMTGVPVAPLLWAIQSSEGLWNRHTGRTANPVSPHVEVDDIFARYAADPTAQGPHKSVWYDSAITRHVKDIVYPLMNALGVGVLGGVLITRIKAGKQVKPHVDTGWHALEYEKFAVQIQSAPGQYFCFEDQKLEAHPGDVYWFNNQHTHWVTNNTPHDRITMIVCVKEK